MLFFPLFAAPCFAQQPLILSTFAGPPLSTLDQTGLYDRILKEAFQRLNLEIEIIHLPAERSLINANEGITDGDFVRVAGLDKMYPNLVLVPEKITDFEFVAFTRLANIKITGWDSLRPYHIAIVRGWKILEQNIVGTVSLIKVKNQFQLFSLLAKDRTDIVVYSRFEGYEMINQLGIKGAKALSPPLAVRAMYLYLNKKHKKLIPLLNRSLKTMKRDGRFETIKSEVLSAFTVGKLL